MGSSRVCDSDGGWAPMSKWLFVTLQWLCEAQGLRTHAGARGRLWGRLQSAKNQRHGEWPPHGDCRTVGLHPKHVQKTTPKATMAASGHQNRPHSDQPQPGSPERYPAYWPRQTPSQDQEGGESHQHPANLRLGLSQGTRCRSRTCSGRVRHRPGVRGTG